MPNSPHLFVDRRVNMDGVTKLLPKTTSERIGIAIGLCILVSGCVTTQGPATVESGTSSPAFSLDLGDLFSPKVSEFKKFVNEKKFREAEELFDREYSYFVEKYSKPGAKQPEEFVKLAQYIWNVRYDEDIKRHTAYLGAITNIMDTTRWAIQARQINDAKSLLNRVGNERTFGFSKLKPEGIQVLDREINRVTALANANWKKALEALIPTVVETANHSEDYPITPIQKSHFRNESNVQTRLLDVILSDKERSNLERQAKRFKEYLSDNSRDRIDQAYVDLYKAELLADGGIDLNELGSILKVETPFGNRTDALKGIANIGYVDLTAASFKDRNIFDFEITFKQDLPVTFVAAKDSLFSSNDVKGYDYLFVTELTAAKINREFKSKKEMKSRLQTGTREDPNPQYVVAQAEYQKAMANFQRAQISSAMPKSCVGWGCLAQALVDGVDQGLSRSSVDKAAASLSNTPQTLSKAVYSEYAYESVDINAAKLAHVDYYVIDVKKKKIHKNNFEFKDHEKFTVSYNVHDNDPDKASILKNNQSEKDVTNWEKKPVSVSLSALFNPANQTTATTQSLTSFEGFLKTFGNRTYASARPTYSKGGEAKETAGELRQSASSYRAQTIADERFDSIVIIKNAKSIGTGFYVTPELVLTAYHVVKSGSLVEMTFYDGTKTYGKVVDHDIRLDLALIKAQMAGKPLKIHTGPIKLGETVEAIGHPKNYEFTITRGVISAVRKQKGQLIGTESTVEFIQTDTPISPGNSGGPLLLKDVVIGVNDWIRVDKGSQNLNFSVSYNEIRDYLNRFDGSKK